MLTIKCLRLTAAPRGRVPGAALGRCNQHMAASKPRFGRLHQEKLHEQALEHIREALITGEYLPGDRLRESEIADQMGVSRGPIREAFRQLEQEGLIVSQPHRGTYV